MKWIGITGGIGSGKSTVSPILKQNGSPLVDADEIVHNLLDQDPGVLSDISKYFGPGVFTTSEGVRLLDRKALAQRVFQNTSDLQMLESFLHPRVQRVVEEFKHQCEKQGEPFAFYDVPLLFEKNLNDQFDEVWVVGCDEKFQMQRIRNRNHWSDDEIRQRLKNQWPLNEKIQRADHVIWNNGTEEDLKKTVLNSLSTLKVNS